MLGKEILGYHVDETIGSGGYGTVYKVSKTNVSGTYVRALKHIKLPTKQQYFNILNSMGGDYSKADNYFADILNNIVSEIKIFSVLSESGNKNIVRYYENDIVENNNPKNYDIYILMEYLTPFTEYLMSASLTVKDVIKLGKDVLNALIDCHSRNIIHRDIKDDNIFVSPEGHYKIGDFGISKALNGQSHSVSIKGTPNFIAPEVYLGRDAYDHTVDVYSLGIVLYRLLNNFRNPFLPVFPNAYTSEDENLAFEARMTQKIPDLPNMAKNELGEVVLKAISPRKDRYNSAKEFLDALETTEKDLPNEYLSQSIGEFNAKLKSNVANTVITADTTDSAGVVADDIIATQKITYGRIPSLNDNATIGLFNSPFSNNDMEKSNQQNAPVKEVTDSNEFGDLDEFEKKGNFEQKEEFDLSGDIFTVNEEKRSKKPVALIIILIVILAAAVCAFFGFKNYIGTNGETASKDATDDFVEKPNGSNNASSGANNNVVTDKPSNNSEFEKKDTVYVLYPTKIREEPNSRSIVICTVGFGEALSRGEDNGEWSKVNYVKDGRTYIGYVANDLITTNAKAISFKAAINPDGSGVVADIKSSSEITNAMVRRYPVADGYPNQFKVVSNDEFNIGSIIAQIPKGTSDITVLSVSEDGVWAYVKGMGRLYNNGNISTELTEVEGYILYSYLEISKDGENDMPSIG